MLSVLQEYKKPKSENMSVHGNVRYAALKGTMSGLNLVMLQVTIRRQPILCPHHEQI